jgi:hypothetical protein
MICPCEEVHCRVANGELAIQVGDSRNHEKVLF